MHGDQLAEYTGDKAHSDRFRVSARLTTAEKREQTEIMVHMCLFLLHVASRFKALSWRDSVFDRGGTIHFSHDSI